MKISSRALWLLIGALFYSGCAAGLGSLNVSRPVSKTALGLTAVLPFDGHDGILFSDLITNELLIRNAAVIERSHLSAVLKERNMQLQDVVTGKVDIAAIGKVLGVNSFFGSVRPIPVYVSGVQSGKVAAAPMRIVAVSDARILGSAGYNSNTDLLPGSPTYPDVAAMLVNGLLSSD